MNLILFEPAEVDATGEARLTGERARHALRVLGVAPGDTLRAGIVDGPRGTATVIRVDEAAVQVRCVWGDVPPRPAVDVLLALPRPKVMRRLWAQLAALGVGRIVLTNAGRVERDYFDTHVLGADCYRPLLIEGLQQARDTRLPQVTVHRRFRVLIEDELDGLCPDGQRLVAHPEAAGTPGRVIREAERVVLAIGPEGGWSPFELGLLEAHGFTRVGLGPRTLRTDTACVALVALAHDALSGRGGG